MNAKIQKEFKLTIGTNDSNATEDDLIKLAFELENLGNSSLPGRFHIFGKQDTEKEEE